MANKMTKSQIFAALAEKTGMAKKDVDSFMEALTVLAYSEVKKNGVFVVPGFGKMVKVNRKELSIDDCRFSIERFQGHWPAVDN